MRVIPSSVFPIRQFDYTRRSRSPGAGGVAQQAPSGLINEIPPHPSSSTCPPCAALVARTRRTTNPNEHVTPSLLYIQWALHTFHNIVLHGYVNICARFILSLYGSNTDIRNGKYIRCSPHPRQRLVAQQTICCHSILCVTNVLSCALYRFVPKSTGNLCNLVFCIMPWCSIQCLKQSINARSKV